MINKEKLRERFLRDPLPAAWGDVPPRLEEFHPLHVIQPIPIT